MNDTFSQLIPLPENWAGEAENLPSISGIPSAILCHQGRFFARAYDFDDILKMAKIAKDEYANTRKRKKSENK